MQVEKIGLRFQQRITVGNAKGTYDSYEVAVNGDATVQPGEHAAQALIELAIVLKGHLEKELQMAAQSPSAGAKAIAEKKEATMAPPPTPLAPQQFTAKPKAYQCIEPGCPTRVEQPNRRCFPHYKLWDSAGRPAR